MNTEVLRKEFQEILKLEERAEHFYDHYINQINNPGIKDKLISIRDDERKHIEVAKRLVKLVS